MEDDMAVIAVETRSWKVSVEVHEGETRLRWWSIFDTTFEADGQDLFLSAGHYESQELPMLLRTLAGAIQEAHREAEECD